MDNERGNERGQKMENINIALITEDRAYGRALGLALVNVYRNFTVTLFQSVPVHNELDRMDLVLSDSGSDLKIRGKNIFLTEKKSQIDKNYEDNIYKLYKYSNVRSLASELIFIYTNITGRKAVPVRNTNAKIVVFGAVEGGSGCTSAAVAFAQQMKRFHGKKVMYISLEEIESTFEYTGRTAAGKSISEYLYYLFNCEDDQHFPFIESFLVSDRFGVDAFVPSPGRNVLNSLSKEEMQYFVSAALDTGGYDILVIDASNNLGKAAMTCYEMANNICLVTRNGNMNYKEERFIEYFTFIKGEKILDRMGRVVNCADDTVGSGGLLKTVAVLPHDTSAFGVNEGVREIKPDGAYGEAISQLTRSVINNTVC